MALRISGPHIGLKLGACIEMSVHAGARDDTSCQLKS